MNNLENNVSARRNRVSIFPSRAKVIQLVGLLLVLTLIMASFTGMFGGAQRAQAESPVAAAGMPKQPHLLAQRLFQGGAMSCAARANQLANFLSAGPEIILMQLPPSNPDQSMVMASLLPGKGSKSQVVSILSMAPNQHNGCGANYQAIRVVDKSCSISLIEEYPALKPVPAGDNGAQMILLNQNARVIAVPAGKACLIIKQELL